MTVEEAIKSLSAERSVIESIIAYNRVFEPRNTCERLKERLESINLSITALKELQEYREIGTVEECREAIEKQKPKTPDYEGNGYADGEIVYDIWICPNCGTEYEVDYDKYKYCPECGQAIDWSEEKTREGE